LVMPREGTDGALPLGGASERALFLRNVRKGEVQELATLTIQNSEDHAPHLPWLGVLGQVPCYGNGMFARSPQVGQIHTLRSIIDRSVIRQAKIVSSHAMNIRAVATCFPQIFWLLSQEAYRQEMKNSISLACAISMITVRVEVAVSAVGHNVVRTRLLFRDPDVRVGSRAEKLRSSISSPHHIRKRPF
jgi:hypothetical protein